MDGTTGYRPAGLEWLISPIDAALFIRNHWNCSPLKVVRNDSAYYQLHFTEADLEYAIHAASKVPGALEGLSDDEHPRKFRNHEMAWEFLKSGRSLRVNSIQRFSQKLYLLCRTLEQQFSFPSNINMYLSPSAKRALDRHYDTHDVFIAQVYGQKRWRLFDSPVPSPLEYLPPLRGESRGRVKSHRLEKHKGLEVKNARQVTDEFVLRSGDVLYLPRGFWHEAEADSGEVSCHLTIGIQPYTYVDLLTVAMARWAMENQSLRAPLPLGFGTHNACISEVQTALGGILENFRESINAQNALSEVADIFLRSREPLEGRVLDPRAPGNMDIKPNARLRVREGVVWGINGGESEIKLKFGLKSLTLPKSYEPACRYMLHTAQFQVSEIDSGLSDIEKSSLANQLLSAGLLVSLDENATARFGDIRSSIRGWLPVRLSFHGHKPRVEWLFFGHKVLSEPFFQQSVSRLRADNQNVATRTTGPNILLRCKQEIPPSGFIFHVSRCGSTLLSNALKTVPGMVVISEAKPIGTALSPRRGGNGVPDRLMIDVLKGLIHAYGMRRADNEGHLVIKFSSWQLLQIDIVRSIWPDVPVIIVIREPLEVMVSCLKRPPGWMKFKDDSSIADILFGLHASDQGEMTPEAFCARVLGKYFEAASRHVGQKCRVVDYQQLTPSFVEEAINFFDLESDNINREQIAKEFAFYSKDPSHTQLFVRDNESKQSTATELMQIEARRWASEPYQKLKDLA